MASGRSLRGSSVIGALLGGLLASALAGCSGSAPTSTEAEPTPTKAALPPAAAAPAAPDGPVQHPDPSLPVSKRMQGRWRMDIDKVPDIALTKQFRDAKSQGKSKQVRIEYLVTDTEFSMAAYGDRGPTVTRFNYEIASEETDHVLLKRLAEDGTQQQINVVLHDDDVLRIGTGSGEVPLQRIALPEKLR